ncbi:MAG: single-stranded-DNA-specific exonuclease RecJ [Candidatus Levybacteria bacterium RIFCSPHIGHO2_12_FULL_38_12]|nr:MAG: single-stranded-DNA-specific exonuclease RecJ [Candidatus Levybacteria bacterium RIFCSPHIGHO2_01_FULL_38_12]OGH21921.1 MAG: single-stranded-DNA-specific exonuclease RecJ [Candidatus Levybacteria bacterium RIFCSPHIGHO2_02_FULL_37_18]OGH22853.1 MAG: single-stranded-DNA-specific exonuclease RecJ [Candidatus Levybacteria bacterium RIFCSPHIGHO2_12_FULL_38_12]OGH33578.1 MAG: single-stranded-DNA-specific exonuclease RecJ [Candidatus Levybacteria bacterium RIFCSPLOWO2_01_FULL_37_20]OGH44499.1 M
MKKWEIQNKVKSQKSKVKIDELTKVLFENRGIKTNKEREEFLHPDISLVTTENVGADRMQLQKAVDRIAKAVENKEQIIVYGDYDVDGISGTAILWETLHQLGAKVLPYIPYRMDEGYGLSIRGIDKLKTQNSKLKTDEAKLIITVDNGIVAHDAVEYANDQGMDVIITDHHVRAKTDPKAYAIVHTTKLCGTGVAYLLSQEIQNSKFEIRNKSKIKNTNVQKMKNDHLGLVALATIADLVPLTGANRTVAKFGTEVLQKTNRIGLLELFEESGIIQKNIGVYEIGHIIAPRLNAMGRLEFAMDSLRLLCTGNKDRAKLLAEKLGTTNRERQSLTAQSAEHALSEVRTQSELGKLIFISHESYQQGVIGLVAGKLVEEFYRPSIVVSIGQTHSKASARSIHGFNIIEFIRGASEFLVDAGGHPMAAGFTVETAKLALLQKALEERVTLLLSDELLMRSLRIDCELELEHVSKELYSALQELSPFGMGNPEPTFVSKNVGISDMRVIGRDGKHLKLKFKVQSSKFKVEFDAIGFGMGNLSKEFKIGDMVDIAYVIGENTWNGSTKLQLKIKDIKKV